MDLNRQYFKKLGVQSLWILTVCLSTAAIKLLFFNESLFYKKHEYFFEHLFVGLILFSILGFLVAVLLGALHEIGLMIDKDKNK